MTTLKTIPIQFRIDRNLFEHVKKVARMESAKRDEDVSWRDLVRDIIAEKYPIPKNREKVKKK